MVGMRYIVVGGGTGGHIYPALAIADALKDKYREAEILYVGTGSRTERRIVQSGKRNYIYTYKIVRAVGLPRPLFSARLPLFFLNLLLGFMQSLFILGKFRPQIIIGTGGYATVPMILAARLAGIKVFIHEQNATPGLANRVLSRLVNRIGVSWPETIQHFPQGKAAVVGYPVRTNLRRGDRARAKEKLGFSPDSKVIFGFGGSQGARTINRAIASVSPELLPDNIGIILSTGRMNSASYNAYADTERILEENGLKSEIPGKLMVRDYFDDIQSAYDAADLVIARSGAGAIMEIAAMNLPAILIPKAGLPGNHQLHNARQAEAVRGAVVLQEFKPDAGAVETVDSERLARLIRKILSDDKELMSMGEQIHQLWTGDALDKIINEVESLRKTGRKIRKPAVHWYMFGLAQEMLKHAVKGSLTCNEEYHRHMQSFLASPNWRVRNIGVKLAGKCRDKSFIPALLTMITDRTPVSPLEKICGGDFVNVGFIRRNAVSSLREIGIYSDEIKDVLFVALTDRYWEVRAEAVKTLMHITPDEVTVRNRICRQVEKLLFDSSFEVIYEALHTAAQLAASDSVLKTFKNLYYHPNRKVKIAVFRALDVLYARKIIPDKETLYREQNHIFIPGGI